MTESDWNQLSDREQQAARPEDHRVTIDIYQGMLVRHVEANGHLSSWRIVWGADGFPICSIIAEDVG